MIVHHRKALYCCCRKSFSPTNFQFHCFEAARIFWWMVDGYLIKNFCTRDLEKLFLNEKQMNLQYVSCYHFDGINITLFLIILASSVNKAISDQNKWKKFFISLWFPQIVESWSTTRRKGPLAVWLLYETFVAFEIRSTVCGFWFCVGNSKQPF